MVLLSSHRIPRVLWYSGSRPPRSHFGYKTVTFFGAAFSPLHLRSLVLSAVLYPVSYFYDRFGLLPFRSPLLRKSLVYFLFLRVLRCFSSPGSPWHTIYSCVNTVTLLTVSSLIRISADQCSFAAPRSFSQLVTSFFGAWCQGIHHMLLLAWSFKSQLPFLLVSFLTSLSEFRITRHIYTRFLVSCFLMHLLFFLVYISSVLLCSCQCARFPASPRRTLRSKKA